MFGHTTQETDCPSAGGRRHVRSRHVFNQAGRVLSIVRQMGASGACATGRGQLHRLPHLEEQITATLVGGGVL